MQSNRKTREQYGAILYNGQHRIWRLAYNIEQWLLDFEYQITFLDIPEEIKTRMRVAAILFDLNGSCTHNSRRDGSAGRRGSHPSWGPAIARSLESVNISVRLLITCLQSIKEF
jgi:hypothetical protein